MKYTSIGTTDLMASRIIAGCMRIDKVSEADADRFIHTALDLGINLFDHADVYGSTAGACEKLFGRLVTPSMRDQMILQTKCGVIKGRPAYDFSKEHILQSVDESLQRLHTDHVELLLLHRPDTLADPAEIAEAFEILHKSGKVQAFGVSNQNTWQMELLKKYCHFPIQVNQLQAGIAHPHIFATGQSVNSDRYFAPDRDGGVLLYCRLHDITIQAWSPFQTGFFGGVFFDREKYPSLNQALDRIAETHNSTPTAIATAWLLRHPADLQVLSGTMKPERLAEMCQATEITLTRDEWYELLNEGLKLFPGGTK